MYKFFGVDSSEADEVVQKQQFEKNKQAFFGVNKDQTFSKAKPEETFDDALKVFYGV